MTNFVIFSTKTKENNNILPEGKYHAYITEIYTEEDKSTPHGVANVTTIIYDVLSGDKVHKVKQILYHHWSEKSEFQKRVSEFMSVFNLTEVLEEADIINQFVDIELSVAESKIGNEYNKVEHILPYTGDISDWDVARGIIPPSPKPQPKSAAADLVFGDEDEEEEGGEA